MMAIDPGTGLLDCNCQSAIEENLGRLSARTAPGDPVELAPLVLAAVQAMDAEQIAAMNTALSGGE